ncbi:tyrosine-type recombinase/integrase [Bradyrhizobium canariense]|uniref:tyrosine-type recombinase/integrase n=1 Tax=Bradyrhizobium canariense TaxID=255045 RepID=UPI001CA5C000|nr:site-specific integrase [Bradyrhizobium canariense]MBW5439255.1 tyrosine-type recombinase/integrase [Bradyrhizobium canariense]
MAKAKTLTATAVSNIKPATERLEISDAGCPGLRLIVQPSGHKSWAMRFYRPNGKPTKLTLGPVNLSGEAVSEPKIGKSLTLAQARKIAADINAQREQDVDVVAVRKTAKRRQGELLSDRLSHTFAEAVRDFIDDHKVAKTGKKPRRWREVARLLGLYYDADGNEPTVIKNGLCDLWAEKPIVDVDGDDIYHLVEEARRSGIPGLERRNSGTSDARGRSMADALGTMFKWLSRHRRIKANPCIGAHRPPPPATRDRVLNVKTDVRNADELRLFWAATAEVGEPFGAILKLLILTGCRLNEIARLEESELTDDLEMIRLPGSRTKNNLPHDVPLAPLAREILAGTKRTPNCKYVFSTNGRTPVSGFSKIKSRLDEVMDIPHWRIHDLRRSAATGMAGIGIQPHIIEAVLNHVSGAKSGVAGIYNKERYESQRRAALERWADYIANVVEGKVAKIASLR